MNSSSQDQAGSVKQSQLVERFLDNLWAERGLSDNSLQSYRHDLLNLQNRLAARGKSLGVLNMEWSWFGRLSGPSWSQMR